MEYLINNTKLNKKFENISVQNIFRKLNKILSRVVIIDSGTSNLFSIQNALNSLGAETKITSGKNDIQKLIF